MKCFIKYLIPEYKMIKLIITIIVDLVIYIYVFIFSQDLLASLTALNNYISLSLNNYLLAS